jgi:hypothetical protein
VLQVPPGSLLQLAFGPGPTNSNDFQLTWSNDYPQPYFSSYYCGNLNINNCWQAFDPLPGPGSIGGDGSWTIATAATVPEPATLTLLGSALLGLGVVYLRRRRGVKA